MRLIGICGVACVAAMWSGAAVAGTSEDAFLGKLVGSWSGAGTVTGSKDTTLDCTLTVRPATAKVSFSGRCVAEGLGPQSFSGSIAYNDKTGKYEAKSGATSDTTIGVKSGSSVVFTSAIKGIAGSGNSIMKLGASKIVIDTNVTQKTSGDSYVAHVVLAK